MYINDTPFFNSGSSNNSNGKDGVSPTVTIVDIEGGHNITITDVNGSKSFDVMDGKNINPCESKKFELIEEIIIDSDNVTVIERTREPDGTTYSFEEVFINFEMEASATSASLTCRVNDVASVGISDLIGTEKKYCTLQFQANRGLLFTAYQIPVTDKTWAGNVRTRNAEVLSVEAINSLRFSCNTPIPAGSKIRIYAVRK